MASRRAPTLQRVRYEGVHAGIDLVFYGNEGQLEYDYVTVQPGADPSRIRMRVGGADALSLDAGGNLLISRAEHTVTQLKPIVYQMIDGNRREVRGRYALHGRDRIGFEIDTYDPTETLVIHPILGRFLNLSGSNVTFASGVAVDSSGFVYVTGGTHVVQPSRSWADCLADIVAARAMGSSSRCRRMESQLSIPRSSVGRSAARRAPVGTTAAINSPSILSDRCT